VIVLSHPEWWVDHVDELVDALTIAADSPEANELAFPGADELLASADEVVVADPAWWLDHVDELLDGLARAATEREEERKPQTGQGSPGQRQKGRRGRTCAAASARPRAGMMPGRSTASRQVQTRTRRSHANTAPLPSAWKYAPGATVVAVTQPSAPGWHRAERYQAARRGRSSSIVVPMLELAVSCEKA
jgi:hypothetical protein